MNKKEKQKPIHYRKVKKCKFEGRQPTPLRTLQRYIYIANTINALIRIPKISPIFTSGYHLKLMERSNAACRFILMGTAIYTYE
jgi:hypothetical protein